MERYGIPRALYVDWKNVYQRKPTPADQERDQRPLSQFGRMGAGLGIEGIGARSPQTKGRAERNPGVHQNRLVKKLRRKGIPKLEESTRYPEEQCLPEHDW